MTSSADESGKRAARRLKLTPIERQWLSNFSSALQAASDKAWFADANELEVWEELARAGDLHPYTSEQVLSHFERVELEIGRQVGPSAFQPGTGQPWPTNTALVKDLHAVTGISSRRVTELLGGTTKPRIDDLVLLAAFLNLDVAQMLLPSVEELYADAPVAIGNSKTAPVVRASDYALWLLGQSALPFQDWEAFRENSASTQLRTLPLELEAHRTTLEILRARQLRGVESLSARNLLPPLRPSRISKPCSLSIITTNDPEAAAPRHQAIVREALAIRLLIRDMLHSTAASQHPEKPTRFERRGHALVLALRRLWPLLHASGAQEPRV